MRIRGSKGEVTGELGSPPDIRSGVRVWRIADGTSQEEIETLKKSIVDEWNNDPKVEGRGLTEADFELREYYIWPNFPYIVLKHRNVPIDYSRRLLEGLESQNMKEPVGIIRFEDEERATFGFHVPENLRSRIANLGQRFEVSQSQDPGALLRDMVQHIAKRKDRTDVEVLLHLIR